MGDTRLRDSGLGFRVQGLGYPPIHVLVYLEGHGDLVSKLNFP